jgi:hypothetical protein
MIRPSSFMVRPEPEIAFDGVIMAQGQPIPLKFKKFDSLDEANLPGLEAQLITMFAWNIDETGIPQQPPVLFKDAAGTPIRVTASICSMAALFELSAVWNSEVKFDYADWVSLLVDNETAKQMFELPKLIRGTDEPDEDDDENPED